MDSQLIACQRQELVHVFISLLFWIKTNKYFVEHRSAIYFPAELKLRNVRLCFHNLAEHIKKVLPRSNTM
jgi:hypothetical protein